FSLLETVREYALEKLDATTERDRQHRALVMFCVRLADTAAPHLFGPNRSAWHRRLHSEQENLRSAIRWIIDRRDAQLGTELIASLWFWLYQTRLAEGRRWMEAVLALRAEAKESGPTARALMGLAVMAWAQGDTSTMESALRDSVALWRRIG